MKLKLFRPPVSDPPHPYTRGTLYINNVFECWTLEDQDRQLEIHPEAKIYGQTCIPRGTYQIGLHYSDHFKREVPILLDVPGYTYVYIHWGCKIEDTLGCILVGLADDHSEDHLVMSRVTFDGVWVRIKDAHDAGEEITLEIV